MMDVNWVDVLLAVLPAIPANLIVWLYYKAKWWDTALGKGMAVTALAVAAILDLLIFLRFEPEWRDELLPVFQVLYFVLTAGLWLKYRAFRRLEMERKERIAEIVRGPEHRAG